MRLPAATLETLHLWRSNVLRNGAWKRGLIVGLIAGGLQATIHQGGAWLRLEVDGQVLFKTLLSLVIAVTVALSAVAVASRPETSSTSPE
jgi:hypothetical protein